MSLFPAAVLFDLDGTLVDTAPDFVRVLNDLRLKYGRPALAYDEIRVAVSAGARAMIQVGFPEYALDSPEFAALRQEFLDNYGLGLAQESRLFSGMEDLLTALESRNIPWGIVTNKPRIYSVPLLAGLALNERCQVLVCPDDVSQTKPHPEPMYLACNTLSVSPEHTIYVGDHIRDIQAGNNAGMKTIAVGFGYIPSHENINDWQADYCVDNVAELVQHFRFLL
ncbi:MAG: HAD-IA family hydrolase [Agitococcus sp.]|nr:HAD-IA family hydrolase [Agitococcus sp.]